MKKRFLFIMILIMFIPFCCKADNERFYVEITNGSFIVKKNSVVCDDYNDYLNYEDGVLTISDGVTVEYLVYDSDLTITSNDHVVIIGGYRNSGSNTVNLVFDHFKNSESSSIVIYSKYNNITISNSEVYSTVINGSSGFGDKEYGVKVENSIVHRNSQLNVGGPVIINNSTIEGSGYVESTGSYVSINNSNVSAHDIQFDYNVGYMEVYNSTINCVNNFAGQYFGSQLNNEYNNKNGEVYHLENSTISSGVIDFQSSSGMYNSSVVKNCEITAIGVLEGRSSYVQFVDSNVIARGRSNFDGLSLVNSYFESNSVLLQEDEPFYIDNSHVVLKIYTDMHGEGQVNNTYIEWEGSLSFYNNVSFNNSYLIAHTQDGPSSFPLDVFRNASFHNTYIDLLSTNNKFAFYGGGVSNIVFDDNTVFTDIDGRSLYLLKTYDNYHGQNYNGDDDGYHYKFYYDEEGNDFSSSLKVVPTEKVTFKVVNGSWKDGSTEDIVITKDAWDKLLQGEIPTDMIPFDNCYDGSWDIAPNTDDIIKEDVVFTYTFKKNGIVKGIIEDLTENPKTGRFSNTLFIISLLGISIYSYIRLKKGSYFR